MKLWHRMQIGQKVGFRSMLLHLKIFMKLYKRKLELCFQRFWNVPAYIKGLRMEEVHFSGF